MNTSPLPLVRLSLSLAFAAIVATPMLRAADSAGEKTPSATEKTDAAVKRTPEEDFMVALMQAETVYRKSLAASLADADDIQVFLLDFKAKRAGSDESWYNRLPLDEFPIIPYHEISKILKRKVLSQEERKLLVPALQRILSVEVDNPGAGCHFPIHGIRIWSKNVVVFQTSICWHCENFYVKYPAPDEASFIGFSDAGFKAIMNRLMPIPQSEIDRFNTYNPFSTEELKKRFQIPLEK